MSQAAAKVEVRYWKEHECSTCGAAYRYFAHQRYFAHASDEYSATAKAEAKAVKAITRHREIRPCPSCGRYQPDMIGLWRSRRHWLVLAISFAIFAVVFIIAAAEEVPQPIMVPQRFLLWLATGIGAVTLMAHVLVAKWSFNKNLEANLARSRSQIEAGELLVTRDGDDQGFPPGAIDHSDRQRGALPIFLLMLVPVLIMPAAELGRLQQGWPFNSSWHPGVAGPGDEPFVVFPNSISSLKGYWNGVARARVLNSAELGLANEMLFAESSTTGWGDQIFFKPEEKSRYSRLWARIAVPKMEAPADKIMHVQIDLQVIYPIEVGNKFENVQENYSHTAELALAQPGAAKLYTTLWWLMGLGGAVCLCLFGLNLIFFRCQELIRKAKPNRIYTASHPDIAVEPAEIFSRARFR